MFQKKANPWWERSKIRVSWNNCQIGKYHIFYQTFFLKTGKSLVRKKWSDQADETMGDYLCGQVFIFSNRRFLFFQLWISFDRWFRCTGGWSATVNTKKKVRTVFSQSHHQAFSGDIWCDFVQHLIYICRNNIWKIFWFLGRDNIEIAFMYSQCGEDWKQARVEKKENIKRIQKKWKYF